MRRFTLLLLFGGCLLALALPAAAGARTVTVQPKKSIQAAVDRARPGDRIFVKGGTYHEQGRPCPAEPGHTCAVVIQTDSISLIGRPRPHRPVVIENAGDQDLGIAVGTTSDAGCLDDPSARVDGSLISNMEVKGFADDGVFLFCVDNWRVTNVDANDNAEYGIFPSHVGSGRVDHSTATGSNDTGVYVGQSHDVEVDNNVANGNVSGFEIENSSRVHAHNNESFGNTGGLLTFTLPNLDVKVNSDNEVDHNNVHDNNKANTCLDPEDTVCAVPPGTGILNLAADTNEIHDNSVTGNNTFGIAVANFCTGNPSFCAGPLDIDIFPDGNRVRFNTVTGNGGAPDPSVPAIFANDISWDTSGTGNCWEGNVNTTQFPPSLPSC